MPNPFQFFKRTPPVTPDAVLQALGSVMEPELNRDIVTLDMVKHLSCDDGTVRFTIVMREAGSPVQVPLERMAQRAVRAIAGVRDVEVRFENVPNAELRNTNKLNLKATYVIAVASGKGGVGKSTVAVNLAAALARAGKQVGLLDGDIHGPNVPLMLGIPHEQPIAFGEQLFPPHAHGVKVMSMGFLVPEGTPVIWRGPMLHQALRQLVRDVMWGTLDYLIVDLPPGTGDVQLTLTQSLPLSGALMVTTPQRVAQADVLKGAEMFRQLDIDLLGIIENMSYFVCPDCGGRKEVFKHRAGDILSEQLSIPLVGRIPLDELVAEQSDSGVPLVIAAPDSPAARAFTDIATALETRTAEVVRQRATQKKPQFIPLPLVQKQ